MSIKSPSQFFLAAGVLRRQYEPSWTFLWSIKTSFQPRLVANSRSFRDSSTKSSLLCIVPFRAPTYHLLYEVQPKGLQEVGKVYSAPFDIHKNPKRFIELNAGNCKSGLVSLIESKGAKGYSRSSTELPDRSRSCKVTTEMHSIQAKSIWKSRHLFASCMARSVLAQPVVNPLRPDPIQRLIVADHLHAKKAVISQLPSVLLNGLVYLPQAVSVPRDGRRLTQCTRAFIEGALLRTTWWRAMRESLEQGWIAVGDFKDELSDTVGLIT